MSPAVTISRVLVGVDLDQPPFTVLHSSTPEAPAYYAVCPSRAIRSLHKSDFQKECVMTVERALRMIAGAFVALSVLLGIYVNANFLWFTLFVGVNLFQSAFTNWCQMMMILRKGGLRNGPAPSTAATSTR